MKNLLIGILFCYPTLGVWTSRWLFHLFETPYISAIVVLGGMGKVIYTTNTLNLKTFKEATILIYRQTS